MSWGGGGGGSGRPASSPASSAGWYHSFVYVGAKVDEMETLITSPAPSRTAGAGRRQPRAPPRLAADGRCACALRRPDQIELPEPEAACSGCWALLLDGLLGPQIGLYFREAQRLCSLPPVPVFVHLRSLSLSL